MLAFDSVEGAMARQISELPRLALTRRTSVHVRPPPDTVSVCPPVARPSDDANASSSRFGPVVVTAAVLVPRPSEKTVASTVMPADGGPVDTTRFTELPAATIVPAAGDRLMTEPDGTVVLDAVVTVPTTSPAFVIAVVAADCVRLTTPGTLTCSAPVETVRLTALPDATDVPATGVWLITEPEGTVALEAVVTVP